MSDYRRQPATVRSVRSGPEDHGINTCYVMLDLDDGGTQGFGGLILEGGLLKSFESDLFWLFGTGCAVLTWGAGGTDKAYGTEEQLVGQKCYALRALRPCGSEDEIVGLESAETGRIMTIEGWRKRNGVGPTGSPLEEKRGRIERDIEWHRLRIREQEARLATLGDGYKQWDEIGMERPVSE